MQSDSGKLFIGGISWETDEERLKEYFSSFGDVVEAVIMKDRSTGRARGFGFVVFSDPNVADQVIKLKHTIDGRMVEAKKAIPRDDQSIPSRNSSGSFHSSPGAGNSKKIFVGGLASTVTESDFKKYFDQFGMITDVVVMYDHNTQRPRGFGFITYDSQDSVEKVLIKTFHELNGKMVEVKRAVPKESSPVPNRGPLIPYRVYSLLNGHNSPNVGLGGFPYGDFAHRFGMKLDQSVSPLHGETGNLGRNVSMSSFYVKNSNRLANSISYDNGNGKDSSFFSLETGNLWGIDGMRYNLFSGLSNSQLRSGTEGPVNWSTPSRVGSNKNFPNDLAFGYGGKSSFDLEEVIGYNKKANNCSNQAGSFSASNGSFDGSFAGFYGGSLDYNDPTWCSLNPERKESGLIDYGLRTSSVNIPVNGSLGYIGGYTVSKRQSSRGIAA